MTSTTDNQLPKMQYVRLGNTGMRISKIGLGCMSYGSSKWSQWVLEEKESMEMIKHAYDAGINFFDTANGYSSGASEVILGKAIKHFGFDRSKIVVATKVYFPFVEGQPEKNIIYLNPEQLGHMGIVNQSGLSRKHIFDSVDASLRRLQLDYIDLFQIHRIDPNTPPEETMEALHDLVRMGKIRYIGASSMWTWQFQKLNNIAEKNGWTKFVSMQNLYNLVYREEEREMAGYCLDAKIGWIPWSPLAGGILARRLTEKTTRTSTGVGQMMQALITESDNHIVERIHEIADKHSATPSQIALAWCWSKPYVSAPILGISKKKHLDDLVCALNVKLTSDDIKYLEELYVTKKVFGHQ